MGQVIDASTLRQAAGGSFSMALDGADWVSITFARTSPTSYRVHAGLWEVTDATPASPCDARRLNGLPSITVDPGMRAARDEARVVPLIGPRGRTVGRHGRRSPDKVLSTLSRDGLRFGDPVRGTTRSSMTLISSIQPSHRRPRGWHLQQIRARDRWHHGELAGPRRAVGSAETGHHHGD